MKVYCLRCPDARHHYARGLCHKCYTAARLDGTLPESRPRRSGCRGVCDVCGLPRYLARRGLCGKCAGVARVTNPENAKAIGPPKGCFVWDSHLGPVTGEYWRREEIDDEPCVFVRWDATKTSMWTPEAGLELYPYEETGKGPKSRVRGLQTAKTGKCESWEVDEWPM